MSLNKEVWDTLSVIDVSKHIQEKNGLKFLSWAWAWGVLMDNYPDSVYHFDDVARFEDGSAEVWVAVSIARGEARVVRRMWLPVMDFRNKSIINPNSRDINDARMRCLTKCLAMLGLGHYIYAGEDVPRESSEAVDQRRKLADYIINAIAEDDPSSIREAWRELDKEEQSALWVAKTKGGYFTQKEKDYIRSSLTDIEGKL